MPGTWSFVVGAKGVSEALAGVPQFSKLALHFRHSRLVVQGWKTWERDPKTIDICSMRSAIEPNAARVVQSNL